MDVRKDGWAWEEEEEDEDEDDAPERKEPTTHDAASMSAVRIDGVVQEVFLYTSKQAKLASVSQKYNTIS